MEEPANLQEAEKIEEIARQVHTAGGCLRSYHVEITSGLGRFDSVRCPKCGLDVYHV